MPLDKQKLVKLLGMTKSDNDHEALVAIRMANKLLDEAKISWVGLAGVKEVGSGRVAGGASSGARPAWAWKKEPPSWVNEERTMSVREGIEFLEELSLEPDDAHFFRMFVADWKSKNVPSQHYARFYRIIEQQKKELGI